MGRSGSRLRAATLAAVVAIAATGCTELYTGVSSLTLVSVASTRDHYEPIGSVRTGSDCQSAYLFLFGNGDTPSHEAVLARLLADAGADVLLNARLKTDRISLLLYTRTCAVVSGQPAKLVAGRS